MLISKYKTKDGKINLSLVFNESELVRSKTSPNHLRATYHSDYEIHLDSKLKVKVCDIINFDKLPKKWED